MIPRQDFGDFCAKLLREGFVQKNYIATQEDMGLFLYVRDNERVWIYYSKRQANVIVMMEIDYPNETVEKRFGSIGLAPSDLIEATDYTINKVQATHLLETHHSLIRKGVATEIALMLSGYITYDRCSLCDKGMNILGRKYDPNGDDKSYPTRNMTLCGRCFKAYKLTICFDCKLYFPFDSMELIITPEMKKEIRLAKKRKKDKTPHFKTLDYRCGWCVEALENDW